jgi:hypothetical protein
MTQRSAEQILSDLAALGLLSVQNQYQTGSKAWIPAHGSGALLSSPGVRAEMSSAIRQVSTWQLPLFASANYNEKIEIFTAQDASAGSNPPTYAGDPVTAGNLRVMEILRTFGWLYMGTDPIIAPFVGLRLDRADIDRFPTNGFDISRNPFYPDVLAGGVNVNSETGKVFVQAGQEIAKLVARTDYQGNSSLAYSATQKGWLKEYDGLDRMVKTGYADPSSTLVAPAVDSRVVAISATLAGSHVATISNLYRTLKMRAELVGKPNVQFCICINPRMKYPLIDIWACNYQTARCDPTVQTTARVDQGRVTELREQMLNGGYLLIDGEPVPLMTNFGVPAAFHSTANTWTSDLFICPLFDPDGGSGMQANGVEYMTYRQYFPMDNTDALRLNEIGFQDIRVSNGGLYMIGRKLVGMSVEYLIAMQLRLMLDYPFLAGRADDITYTNSTPFGTPFTDEADYVGGGDDAR